MQRWSIFGLLLTLVVPPAALAQRAPTPDIPQTDSERPDILCDHAPAGMVAPLPELVRDWVTIICSPTGQALVPQVTDAVILWLIHGTTHNFMLEAVPPQIKQNAPQIPAYELRFVEFSAVVATDERRRLSLDLWKLAFDSPELPPTMGEVVQMEAHSVYNATIFRLFFYLRDGTPRWLLVCRDRCDQSVSLDVLQGVELDALVAEQAKRARPGSP